VSLLRAKKLTYLAAGALVALGSAAVPAAASADLNGSGSTLVAPLEAEWASTWSAGSTVKVNYNAVGSGQGIKDIISRLTDFGGSDAPLTPSQRSQCGNCVMIPWALGSTAVGYNLGGVRKLKLTGAELAGIYLGQITRWNDPRIAATNRGTGLPNEAITPVFRSDGSGDTYAFTDFLSRVSSAFRGRVGTATTVGFPTGVSGKGNSGVTSVLQSTPGSIAYIASSYLIARRLPAVAVGNAAGKFVYPNLSNIENAARSVTRVPASGELHIVNPSRRNKNAYPIATFTYVIAHTDNAQGGPLRSFINYALGSGQQFGPGLDFAPLPSAVKRAARAAVNRIH
jgi:phosphate transport system substrate-binding protein